MQTNVFPKIYETQTNERTNEQIEVATNESNNRIKSLNEEKNRVSRHTKDASFLVCLLVGVKYGFFVSWVPCFIIAGFGLEGMASFFVAFLICVIIVTIIFKKMDNANVSANRRRQASIIDELAAEESGIEKKVENIKANALREQKEYTSQFEKNAQDMSVQFAESELAKEVIEWMTQGFCKTIDSANRQSHVEEILVPFVFNIYTDKITCNLGTYDFELHRCRNLSSPVEQTALARAIVSAIQLYIIMKYPKDASGTDVTINIDYSYTEEYPITTITYVAPNGNYEAVKGW